MKKVTVLKPTSAENGANESSSSESSEDESNASIPRGQPKSGRFWKSEKTRARSVVKTRGLQISLEKKMKLKRDLLHIKSVSREIIDKRKKDKEDRRTRVLNNIKKKQENQKKSEIVQVIKNPQKIKRMRKKQLRSIEKRDTLSVQK